MRRNLSLSVFALALVALGCGGDDGSDTVAESSGGIAGEAGAGGAGGEAGAGGAAGAAGAAGAGGAVGEGDAGGAAGEAGVGGTMSQTGTGGDECGDVLCAECEDGFMPVDNGGCCPACVAGCSDDANCPEGMGCLEGECVAPMREAFTEAEADELINRTCSRCHVAGGTGRGGGRGWDQMSYAEVLGRVTGTTGQLMPIGGRPWSDDNIERLRLLVEQ